MCLRSKVTYAVFTQIPSKFGQRGSINSGSLPCSFFFGIRHLTSLCRGWNVKHFSPQGSVKYYIIIISLDSVSLSPGAGGVAWGRSGKATGAERRAARAALRAGSGTQWAGSAAQPGPPGAAGAGDPSGAAPTTGLRLRARGTAPAGGPLHWTGMEGNAHAALLLASETILSKSQWHLQYAYWLALLVNICLFFNLTLYILIIPCSF